VRRSVYAALTVGVVANSGMVGIAGEL